MQTKHTFTVSVGGPAYGFPCAAYVRSESAPWLNDCFFPGDSPEEGSAEAQRAIRLDAQRCGYEAVVNFAHEN